MRQPRPGGARFDRAAAAAGGQRLAHPRIDHHARPLGADRQLDPPVAPLGPDVEPPAADQRIARDHRQVEQQFDRPLGQRRVGHHPAQLDPPVGAVQPLDRALRLARVDRVAEPATGAERQPEEFQLVGAGPRAVGEQFHAPLAHRRVLLVGQQFEPVVERAHRRHQIVAQAAAHQAGKVDRVHRRGHAPEFNLKQGSAASPVPPSQPIEGPETASHIPVLMGGHQLTEVALGDDHRGWRLDRALADALPTLSRERLKALVNAGALARPDGSLLRDPATKVKGDECFTLAVPDPTPAHNEAQDIPLVIAYEDEHLLVVDKPAGLVVHPAAGNRDGTLVNALLHHCHGSLSGIGGVARPGIVHRIDKDTSGLLVVAKTDRAHEGLARQFADHSIERRYLAIVSDVPRTPEGKVDAPLARSPHDRKKVAIVHGPRGKRAVTDWRLLAKLDEAALVECRLETGRTHQVRVHMASIGHPLVGDPVYGRTRKRHRSLLASLGFERQALHAARLGFIHPISKDRLSFDSPLPSDMQRLFSALGL